jgi:hypothetical protein
VLLPKKVKKQPFYDWSQGFPEGVALGNFWKCLDLKRARLDHILKFNSGVDFLIAVGIFEIIFFLTFVALS